MAEEPKTGDRRRRTGLRRQGALPIAGPCPGRRPVGMAQWVEAYRRDERATVRAVTEDLAAQLARVNPGYTSWAQAEQLAGMAAVVVRTPDGSGAAEVALADQVEAAARLAAVQDADPASLRQLFVDFAGL